MPLKMFFCYAHEDEALLNKLKTHLSPLQRTGLIDVWYDRDIRGGAIWEKEIDTHLNKADIILLLVSPDFMASDYCYGIEMQQALEREQRGEARVIPIILRPTHWRKTPLGELQALPRDGKPVTDATWNTIDYAFHNVTEGIREVAEEFIQQPDHTFLPSSKPLQLASPPSLTPRPKRTTARMILIASIAMLVTLALIIGETFLQKNNPRPSAASSPTATHSATAPISTTPTQSPSLYQADFSKGDQGWLTSTHPPQWIYSAKDQALESDGSSYCCSASTITNIIIIAPYTVTTRDYTVEARIRVTGINTNHSYTESDPGQDPFFGLFVRGDVSNKEGHMVGINGLPIGDPHAGAYSTFLAFGSAIKIFHGKEAGGEDYVLDKNWHTYRVDVKADSFLLSIDNTPVYSSPMKDSNFLTDPNVGIEDYDFYLQVQSFTISP